MARPKRYQHIQTVASAIADLRKGASAKSRLHQLMLELITPAHKEVYDWYTFHYASQRYTVKVDSFVLASEFNYQINYASTLLKELWEFGLLERELDDDGRTYLYWYASWERETWTCE